MRRLMCAVLFSIGMMTGCGGSTEMDAPDALGSVEQGLACAYPNMTCPSGTICVYDYELCRKPCPSSGICSSGAACSVSPSGQKYCN
jgi:hypothetical protein